MTTFKKMQMLLKYLANEISGPTSDSESYGVKCVLIGDNNAIDQQAVTEQDRLNRKCL